MGKRKATMKLSSRKTGTLVPNDDDSDSDLQEFSLPKKRIIKPGKSTYVARLEIPVSKNIVFCRVSVKLLLYFVLFIALKVRKFTFEPFRRRCDCCRVCASVFLSVLLIASVLCVIVLGWFSLRLKRDLDFVRKRLSKGESAVACE